MAAPVGAAQPIADFELPGRSEGRSHAVARLCALLVAALAVIVRTGKTES